MSLEQLQDFALDQQTTLNTKDEELKAKDTTIAELQELNKTLQQRNNELFRRVEQQSTPGVPKDQEGPQNDPQTCEDFAKEKYKEFIK